LPNDRTITQEDVKKINIDTIEFNHFSKDERETIKLITYASIIKNLLNLHKQDEKTKLMEKLISDFNKLFKKQVQKEKELCLLSALLSEKLWEDATKVYKGKSFKIELSHLILCIWLFEEKRLQKQFLYSKQKIGKIAQALKTDDAAIVEKNNRDLANLINQELHRYLEIELPQKKSFLSQLKNNPLS